MEEKDIKRNVEVLKGKGLIKKEGDKKLANFLGIWPFNDKKFMRQRGK